MNYIYPEWGEKVKSGNIAVYSRKSRFTGKGESIENQIELCRQYIRGQFGGEAAEGIEVYEDEGFSGGNLERPQFKKMMADAKNKKISAVVVYRLDRISRNIGDFAKLIEELNSLEVSFVSIREQFDTESPMGRAMMYIASVFSQLERETIAERIRDNMLELAKTGRWLGGTTPTGYESESVERVTADGKTRKSFQLKLLPDEAKAVKTIFEKFIECGSLTGTDAYLLQNGYTTKNGRNFTRFTIKGILTNPVYMAADGEARRYFESKGAEVFLGDGFNGKSGVMCYNRTIQKAGKSNKLRPMSEWIVSAGRHEGIISGEQWIKAQELLSGGVKYSRTSNRGEALLSGLLICEYCGSFMRPKPTDRKNKDGEVVFSYLCSLKERSRSQCCKSRNASGNEIDGAVCFEIKKLEEDREELARNLERGRKTLHDGKGSTDEELTRLKRTRDEYEGELKRLVSSLAKASSSPAEEYVINKIEEIHDKTENLKKRIEELSRKKLERELDEASMDTICCKLLSFEEMFDSMSIRQKKIALRSIIKKVMWDGENIHIYLDAEVVPGYKLSFEQTKSGTFREYSK